MKINLDIECTPEEARRFMGLPDVDKTNEVYVDMISKAMKGVSNKDQLKDYAKQLAPMGQVGLKLFQNFVENSESFSEASRKGKSKDSEPEEDETSPAV